MPTIQEQLHDAMTAYQEKNLPLTDALCQNLIEDPQRPLMALSLEAIVCLSVREYRRAIELLKEVDAKSPGDPEVKHHLDIARKLQREQALLRPDGRRRYLLIKAWGYGFCSDLDHVLGSLLLAEITGRTPVIHWGQGSLFRDDPDDDAWPAFFEPVSKVTVSDLLGKKYSFFPPKWNESNLKAADVNKFEGFCSRMAGLLFLNQREDVAVSDIHVGIVSMAPWLKPGTPYADKPVAQIYRMVINKHLRLNPAIAASVDQFAAANFAGRRMIAVHARGTDKVVEDAELGSKNQQMPDVVAALAAKHPDAGIFLLTDDDNIRRSYLQQFGPRLVTTECARNATPRGLHYTKQDSRRRLGVECLRDIYLAARCDEFVGVGSSNVSAMIEHLKDWPAGSLTLLSPNMHYRRNEFLYRWTPPPGFVENMAAHQARIDAAHPQ